MSADSTRLSDPACLFCRIVTGEVAAEILYRDEMAVAFRDVNPVAPTHILIIPARHITSLHEHGGEDGAVLDHMAMISRRLAEEAHVASSAQRLVCHTRA